MALGKAYRSPAASGYAVQAVTKYRWVGKKSARPVRRWLGLAGTGLEVVRLLGPPAARTSPSSC